MNEFININLAALEELALNEKLIGEPFRILIYLISIIEVENLMYVDQNDISRELEISPFQLNRHLKTLCNEKIIAKGPKIKNKHLYKMNPTIAWKETH